MQVPPKLSSVRVVEVYALERQYKKVLSEQEQVCIFRSSAPLEATGNQWVLMTRWSVEFDNNVCESLKLGIMFGVNQEMKRLLCGKETHSGAHWTLK